MSKYTILLDHQPYHLEDAERYGVDFQFSGHTHYGQVWPISWIEDRMYEDAFGSLQKGNTHYYVSSGIGICCSSEFTLRTMAYVSIFIPFVLAYIVYAWRALDKKEIDKDEIAHGDAY